MKKTMLAIAALLATCGFAVEMKDPQWMAGTPVCAEVLDNDAFTVWLKGAETSMLDLQANPKVTPESVLWSTTTKNIVYYGLTFGAGKEPGPRHLRCGFKSPVAVETVLVAGGGVLSVLKPDAPYPGRMDREADWLTAQRLDAQGKPTQDAVPKEGFGVWTLPAGTKTRALRFTHVALPSDSKPEGFLGGALVLTNRFVNVAPHAQIVVPENQQHVSKLTDMTRHSWGAWGNIPVGTNATRAVLSEAAPEPIILVWDAPVTLDALVGIATAFSAMEVDAYTGPAAAHPRMAAEADWKPVAQFSGFRLGYPVHLWPNYFAFDAPITARAIRVRITAPMPEDHEHLRTKTNGGRRFWLDQLLALARPAAGPFALPAGLIREEAAINPPIPVPFRIPEAGYVTLVIEDKDGTRVRNLVSETWFPAGRNTAWWDGTDDLGRDLDAARHGLYNIPLSPVAPGAYTARGLWHKGTKLAYEFSVYAPGNPPWDTPDHTGAWLANHSPPSGAAFVPAAQSPTGQDAVFLGSFVTEGPDGFIWVGMDGVKQGGLKWIGGHWTAAPYIAVDTGPAADTNTCAYIASVFRMDDRSKKILELRLSRMDKNKRTHEVLKTPIGDEIAEHDMMRAMHGIAVRDGRIAVALTCSNAVWIVDAATGKVENDIRLPAPTGVAYAPDGQLYALSLGNVVKVVPGGKNISVITDGLEAPVSLTIDAKGNFYVSDHGNSHQVKVFSPDGKLTRAIGNPGKPQAGQYDPFHINSPWEVAVDNDGRVWVAENDYLPKRVSLWSADGKLLRAFYGPGKYGGGGQLDSTNPNRFYYADEGHGTLEFTLDWKRGTDQLVNVLYRNDSAPFALPRRIAAPETAYRANGKRYFSNCFNCNPTGGSGAFLFEERNGVAVPVAGMGMANDWPLLHGDAFKRLVPEGSDLKRGLWDDNRKHAIFFIWSDLNGDGDVQPDEVQMSREVTTGVTVLGDLSFAAGCINGKAIRFKPEWKNGRPAYTRANGITLAEGVYRPASSGGDQMLADDSGEAILTLGVEPFHQHSICGVKGGKAVWSYPNAWPGLHPSHEASVPQFPGHVIGPTRLLGGLIQPKGSRVKPLWAINGNMGNIYLFTRDGLFVSQLFEDVRQGKLWQMLSTTRGMPLENITLHDENFWPSIATSNGQTYLVDGARTSIVRVDGLDTLRPIDPIKVSVTPALLAQAQDYRQALEQRRQQASGTGVLRVPAIDGMTVDGDFAKWRDIPPVEIDKRGVAANFNSNSKPYDITGRMAISGGRLHACWDTRLPQLLRNSGEMPTALFKTGGALDLMLGTDPAAKPDRRAPAAGDLRLTVTRVDGNVRALLYRPKVAHGVPATPVPFSSPWRTITFDEVLDVSQHVLLAEDKQGLYEISVPLDVLGLDPKPGQRIRGDIGILRGENNQTTARTYWANKATAITADVPSEAELTPALWGLLEFQ
ncbi:MAG: hypothetical protein FWG50_07330 [Kiritimatiellaeota bacterium]|nr:hypothetical protein [Kiritimatiellota bacterium]